MKQFSCPTNAIQVPMKTSSKKVKVIDIQGNPLEGVHVISEVSNFATITNALGTAMVQYQGGENIMFSHLGKETKVVPVNQITSDIILEDSIEALDDVIIISKPKPKTSSMWLWGLLVVGGILVMRNSQNQPKKVNL
ncbi:hypothetical protein [Aquimarina spongiae]|uniref:Uncharacterized protein n=1 Tax=Aquimarina spongiae TaxID=570521 RepID=A0A1M6JFB2_9FLAO|nr:hypothetical protein [Aquimarina spongiae]SHJ45399.1 hypothetical protein SAMN04488508_10939 [Aquimarina spongiae]